MSRKRTKELPPNPFKANDNPQRDHVKFFLDNEAKFVVKNMSECATEMLLYIMLNMEAGQEQITLNFKDYSQYTGYNSRSTFTNAKSELAQYQFIAPTNTQSIYFINPAYFFRP